MIHDNSRTRAQRRASHDLYAPFAVRPGLRRESVDAFKRMEMYVNLAIAIGGLVFIAAVLRWAMSAWPR